MKNLALILLHHKGKFLLQLRTNDAPTYPGEYAFFGGHMEEGESPEDAVKRECLEELEYQLQEPKLISHYERDSQYGRRSVYVFLEKYDAQKKLVLHEGEAMKWVVREEVKNLKMIGKLKDALYEAYKIIQV